MLACFPEISLCPNQMSLAFGLKLELYIFGQALKSVTCAFSQWLFYVGITLFSKLVISFYIIALFLNFISSLFHETIYGYM